MQRTTYNRMKVSASKHDGEITYLSTGTLKNCAHSPRSTVTGNERVLSNLATMLRTA